MAAAMAKIEAQETAEMAEMAAKDAHVVDYVNPEKVTELRQGYDDNMNVVKELSKNNSELLEELKVVSRKAFEAG